MYEMEQIDERVILVGIDTGNEDAANRSLDELSELAKTAKAAVVGRLIQPRESAHPGTYREKERSRWSLLSFDTERQDWRGLADLYPVSAGGSEREVREKKSWRWTGV